MVEFQFLSIVHPFIAGNRIYKIPDVFQHIHPCDPYPEFHLHDPSNQLEKRFQPYFSQDFLLHQVHLVPHHILPQYSVKAIGRGADGGNLRPAHGHGP